MLERCHIIQIGCLQQENGVLTIGVLLMMNKFGPCVDSSERHSDRWVTMERQITHSTLQCFWQSLLKLLALLTDLCLIQTLTPAMGSS